MTPPEVPEVAAFVDLGVLGRDHTCLGLNQSPPLTWQPADLPDGTRFLAWLVHSPSGVSWAAWDAPAEWGAVRGHFPAAHAPPLQGLNHRGRVGWAGPCPSPTAGPLLSDAVELQVFALSNAVVAPPTAPVDDLTRRFQAASVARSTSLHTIDLSP